MSPKELRKFGVQTGLIFGALFGLFFPWLWDRPWPLWPWYVAGALMLPALVYPKSLKWVHWAWMKLAHALGWVNTRILLTLFFYLFLTPFGFIMRLIGKDPLVKKTENSNSYRIASPATEARRMEDPY